MLKLKPKIYLDTNIYGRLFDDLSDPILYAEAIACLSIFKFIEQEKFYLITSDVLELEINQTEPLKRNRIIPLLSLSQQHIKLNNEIIQSAKLLENKINLSGPDALHLAFAIKGGSKYFITQDKQILNKTDKINQTFNNQTNLIITNALSLIQQIYGYKQ